MRHQLSSWWRVLVSDEPNVAIRIFVNGRDRWLERLRAELARALEELELDGHSLPIETRKPPDGTGVSLALLFAGGPPELSSEELEELDSLRGRGVTVIPVVDTEEGFRRKIPERLGKVNAFRLGVEHPDFSGLVAEILDRVWQLRPKRKVFLSYRRKDSAAVARQLQDRLTNRGYEVFLDESSIPPGADFQRELMSWLNDADFLLLLASPTIGGSKWVMEEIQFANHASVGILAVCWPLPTSGGTAGERLPAEITALMEDQRFHLSETSFDTSSSEQKLTEETVREVVARVDAYRARAVRLRLRALMPFIRRAAADCGVRLEPAGRFGDFRMTFSAAREIGYVRVLPYRPTLESVNDLCRELAGHDRSDFAACFYSENDVNHPQKTALDWALLPARPDDERGPRRYRLLAYRPAPGAALPDLAGLFG